MDTMQTHAPSQRAVGFAHPRRNIGALGIQGGMKVADFGAGGGAYTLLIAERLGGSGHVYAIDVQRDLLRRTANEAEKRGFKNVEIIWADLETPRASKLADHSIDLVLISNLLFQIPDKLPVLGEARRIVKPGGQIALIDWADSFRGMGPQKEDVVSKEAAIGLAEAAGLSAVREFVAGAHHYGLILRPAAGKNPV
jgi:ubiquinone/menaquinone biosynthesis C-methylase UbiE